MKPRWLFFDIGYTLADETEVWKIRCREQAETPEAKALGLTTEAIWREIEQASREYRPQFRAVIEKYGFTQAVPFRGEWETPYPDALPVLARLSRQYALGVIANQTKGLSDRLREWRMDGYFSVVVSSWEAGVWKPDPAIFRLALQQAGCAPQESVMIGDRLDNDIGPAKALGMKTVWLRQGFGGLQTPKGPAFTPDGEIDSLNELEPLLAAL